MAAAQTALDAQDQLGDAVSVYLDAGKVGAEGGASSIVDVTGTAPVLLREGALTFDQLREVAPTLIRAE